MKKYVKKLLWVFISIFVLYIFFNFHLYSSDAIEGWVIDMDTNDPLEGVEVHIEWNIHTSLIEGTGFSTVKELKKITDKNGYFLFPEWGPILYKRGQVFSYPILVFTKEKYKRVVFDQFSFYYPFILNPWVKFNSNWWSEKGWRYKWRYTDGKYEEGHYRNKVLLEKLK